MTRFYLTAAAAVLLIGAGSLTATAEDAPAPPATTSAPAPTPAPAADPAAIAAAIELMDATGVSKSFENITGMMRQHISAGSQDEPDAAEKMKVFDEMMVKFAPMKPQMIQDTAALYAQKMTAEEMKVITAFYKTGPGAKFITILPDLMKDAGGIGQKYAMKMMKDYRDSKKP